MHNILHLKKPFHSRKNGNTNFGPPTLPVNASVSSEHLQDLKQQLEDILSYWKRDTRIGGALVSVHYRCIVAKSNRIHTLLARGSHSPAESVRGARFEPATEPDKYCHVFTHFVGLKEIEDSIVLLEKANAVVHEYCHGSIDAKGMEAINQHGIPKEKGITKNPFGHLIRDAYYVERFDIDRQEKKIQEESIITIYQTNADTKRLLSSMGINIYDDRIMGQTMLRLTPAEIKKLQEQASYLIAMSVTDFTKISLEDINASEEILHDSTAIPHPQNEPIIGVLDTPFNPDVYFHEWVDYQSQLDPDIPLQPEDYVHGTAVSSILVDGPKGNPNLDDGCGRFRVRHFGIATKQGFSAFTMLRKIEGILAENPDIRVWNLSLGSKLEIDDNFISPVAAELDHLQNKYDVIFVIAGTNRPADTAKTNMRIGSPADSLNSIVVNAVNAAGAPASYTRNGPVLSFFHKPDLSYYGGDGTRPADKIVVCCDNLGACYEAGTSFAAPWITRKLAYLIYIMGMNREVAKALLIDSATGWNNAISHQIGYGVVPKKIQDIIQTKSDEIRFYLTGNTDEYETYDYSLPIPISKESHPFFARATLAYFPVCDRNQGVDYTCTEMDFKFGRVKKEKDGHVVIKDIQKNRQSDDEFLVIREETARNEYRKWDNVKHLSDRITAHPRGRKVYDAGMWGISVKTKERTNMRQGVGLAFGIVITLKEMHHIDRYDDFIKLCQSNGWLVHSVDANVNMDIYLQQEEDIHLE